MTGELVRPPAPGDPERLGRWELCGRLGEGGMGTVHLGRAGRRLAAVKTLRAELLGDARFLARFRREIEAARAARRPYVAAVLDVGLHGPVPWFASEFVAGPTLETCVTGRGPLPEESVRALGGMLARALAALHAAGVVHRDLKPSNVLLTSDGPRVVDFGIARQLGATSLTRSGQVPGSEGYMSPEQVLGRELGPPSDMFVLGALLMYASTGHHAFGAGAQLAAYSIAYEEPEERGTVPVALRETVRRCLSKEPGERPTAVQLAEAWKGPTDGWLPDAVQRDIAALRRQAQDTTGVRMSGVRKGACGTGSPAGVSAGGACCRPAPPTPETTGVPLWKGGPGEVPDPLWSTEALAPDAPFGPTPAGRDVVLVAAPGAVAALDPRTGERRWTHPGGLAPVPAPRPLLIGADGGLRALDPDGGKEVWRGPAGLGRLLAADRDTVYALGPANRIVAVRTGDGTRVWQVPAPPGGRGRRERDCRGPARGRHACRRPWRTAARGPGRPRTCPGLTYRNGSLERRHRRAEGAATRVRHGRRRAGRPRTARGRAAGRHRAVAAGALLRGVRRARRLRFAGVRRGRRRDAVPGPGERRRGLGAHRGRRLLLGVRGAVHRRERPAPAARGRGGRGGRPARARRTGTVPLPGRRGGDGLDRQQRGRGRAVAVRRLLYALPPF